MNKIRRFVRFPGFSPMGRVEFSKTWVLVREHWCHGTGRCAARVAIQSRTGKTAKFFFRTGFILIARRAGIVLKRAEL